MTRYKLPQPTLCPPLLKWSPDAVRIRKEVARRPAIVRVFDSALREEVRLRRKREAPYRLINLRRRLYAAYWAGWKPDWLRPAGSIICSTGRQRRYGEVGPGWLGKPRRPSRRQA